MICFTVWPSWYTSFESASMDLENDLTMTPVGQADASDHAGQPQRGVPPRDHERNGRTRTSGTYDSRIRMLRSDFMMAEDFLLLVWKNKNSIHCKLPQAGLLVKRPLE